MKPAILLRGEWRWLAMLNYAADPAILRPYVPPETEIDDWQDNALLSIVGFLFLNQRVLGLPIPFHANFEQVNLRFYVRRQGPEGVRRGVVFLKQLVPLPLMATLARVLYNEKYEALPMRHAVHLEERDPCAGGGNGAVEYRWKKHGRWCSLAVATKGDPRPAVPGSQEQFVTERFWRYVVQRDGSCMEYQVEHPPWRIRGLDRQLFDCDVAAVYGEPFVVPLGATPSSAFLAEGSTMTLRRPVRIR